MLNIILGIVFIFLGVWVIQFTRKNPDSQLKSSDMKGYIGGFFLIVIGILSILGKLNWK